MDLKITEFWRWFLENEGQYRNVVDVEEAKELLDNQILQFGLFAWEIGKGKKKPFYLTISPNGDRNRLRLSRKIIQRAPNLPHWEFYCAKQPKLDWDYTFHVYDRLMVKQELSAARWEFLLLDEPNDKVRVLLYAGNIHTLDSHELPAIADLVVTNILGEELKIRYIDSVQFVDDFLPEDEEWVFELPDLKEEFLYFIEEFEQ